MNTITRKQIAVNIDGNWDKKIAFLRYKLGGRTIGETINLCVDKIYQIENGDTTPKVDNFDNLKKGGNVLLVDMVKNVLMSDFVNSVGFEDGFMGVDDIVSYLTKKLNQPVEKNSVTIFLKALGFGYVRKNNKRGYLIKRKK